MSRRDKNVNNVERFITIHSSRPTLTIAEFEREEGALSRVDREEIESYLAASAALIQMRDGDADITKNDSFVGMELNHYLIEGVLGRGGTGAVYLASDLTNRRRVALKLLHPAFVHDPARLERFRREAAILTKLRHRNIIQCYETGEAKGMIYITMELAVGAPLDRRIKDGERAGPRELAALGAELASALAAAHAAGIVHRDVKPGNIYITEDGRPLLLDFGLARDAARSTMTGSGNFLGTPVYMSPEQAAPAQHTKIGPASDIFSLGVTLIEYATGAHPFLQMESAFPKVRGVPRPLETILLKCIDPVPERRYNSAEALRDDLLKFMKGERPLGKRAPWYVSFVRHARRRPMVAVAALIPAAIFIIVAVAKQVQANERRDQAEQYKSEARGRILQNDGEGALLWIGRAEGLGEGDAALRAEAEKLVSRREADGWVDAARILVFSGNATAGALAQADEYCKRAIAYYGETNRAAFEPLGMRAMAALRRRDLLLAKNFALAAAESRQLYVPPDLIAEVESLAMEVIAGGAGSFIIDTVTLRESDATPAERRLADRLVEYAKIKTPDSPEVHSVVGAILHYLGMSKEALERLDYSYRLDPRNIFTIQTKVHCYMDLDNPTAAIEALETAIARAPESATLYFLRASILEETQQFEKAEADYTKTIELQPGMAENYEWRGSVRVSLRRADDALSDFSKALELNPNLGFARLRRGIVYYQKKDYKSALAEFNEARGKEGLRTGRLESHRAAAFYQLEKYNDSLAAAEKALQQDPAQAWAWFFKARSEEKLNLTIEAARDMKHCARVGRRAKDVAEEEGLKFADEQARMDAAISAAPDNTKDKTSIQDREAAIRAEPDFLQFDAYDSVARLELLESYILENEISEARDFMKECVDRASKLVAAPPWNVNRRAFLESIKTSLAAAVIHLRTEPRFNKLQKQPWFPEVIARWKGVGDKIKY